jgi:hypothetical protein
MSGASRVTETPLDSISWMEAVTTSDATNHANGPYTALNVTTAGAYKVTTAYNQDVVINLAAGMWHPVRVKRVWSTGSVSTAGITGGRLRPNTA